MLKDYTNQENWTYNRDKLNEMSRDQLKALGADNAHFTSFVRCSNCGCYKELHAKCWNCGFDK